MLSSKEIMDLSNKATAVRQHFGEDANSPIDIFALAQTLTGLTLVLYPLGKNISGMCHTGTKIAEGVCNDLSAVIALNSQMSRGRQRFTLAHELYHYFYTKMAVVCPLQFSQRNQEEEKADRFASYLLMPQFALFSHLQDIKSRQNSAKLSLAELVRLEQYFGLSRQAILYRLKLEQVLSTEEADMLSCNVIHSAQVLGYDTSLYLPTNIRTTLGRYISLAERLHQNGKISDGKYEELLLEAYRDDIVYGAETGGEYID